MTSRALLALFLVAAVAGCKARGDKTSVLADDQPTVGDYMWNNVIPEKKPATPNGKLVLFDNSHMNSVGDADWVLDGGFSAFADALVAKGYTVREYRGVDRNGDGSIRYFDDRKTENQATNEAVVDYDAIKDADVFVTAEANRPYTRAEQDALAKFVADGKGIYFICDHYNSDRNMNTWDCTETYNGYNRSTAADYNYSAVFGNDAYGDLRNPQDAGKGWLSETFGLRFRFNAINWKNGVSGIRPAAEAEGVTAGVQPILLAAGSTLAIVRPEIAKGIIYFGADDQPTPWVSAADQGLYFGGEAEGPFVALSKPSRGKAAFIGDSSPIENLGGKYRREDNGRPKSLNPGWTSRGSAATLSVNIVDWLAKSEDYVGFDGTAHAKGVATPQPLAEIEKDLDPTKPPEPWATPSFDPWDAATFAPGAYLAAKPGAPLPPPTRPGNGASGHAQLSLAPAQLFPGEPFIVLLSGDSVHPTLGAFKQGGSQVGRVLKADGTYSNTGYNEVDPSAPVTAKVDSTAAAMSLRIKIGSQNSDTLGVVGVATGAYGWFVGRIDADAGDFVVVLSGAKVVSDGPIAADGSFRVPASPAAELTLGIYGADGGAKQVLGEHLTITAGAETPLAGP